MVGVNGAGDGCNADGKGEDGKGVAGVSDIVSVVDLDKRDASYAIVARTIWRKSIRASRRSRCILDGLWAVIAITDSFSVLDCARNGSLLP